MATETKTIRVNLLRREARAPRGRRAPAVPTVRLAGSRLVQLAVVVLLLEIAGFVAWGFWLYREAAGYRRETALLKEEDKRLQMELEEKRRLEAARADIQRRLEVIGRVARSQGLPVTMMTGVLQAVPSGLWLSSLEMKPQEVRVKETPRAAAPAQAGRVLGQLEEKRQEATEGGAPAGAAGPPREVIEIRGYTLVIRGVAFNNFQVADFMENLRKIEVFSDVDFTMTEATAVEQIRAMSFEVTANVKL